MVSRTAAFEAAICGWLTFSGAGPEAGAGKGFAAGAAVLTVLMVWIDPRWRRAALVPIVITAFARIASGAETPYDVAIALMLGWLVGSVVLRKVPAGIALCACALMAGLLKELGVNSAPALRGLDTLLHALHVTLRERAEQRFLRRKVIEQAALGDACLRRDALQRHMRHAFLQEQGFEGVQDAVAGVHRHRPDYTGWTVRSDTVPSGR